MQGWMNPYEVLGTTRAASQTEVREAYHAAVLRYHPDRRPGDPRAQEEFERIVEAYRTILRWRGQFESGEAPAPFPAVSPSQLAARAQETVHGGAWGYVESPVPMGAACRRIWRATRDEPLVFAAIWLAALLAGLGVELALVGRLPMGADDGGDPLVGVALLVAGPLVAYAAILALAVAVPVMTRKAVYLVMQFSQGLRKALPSPRTANLPRGPKARLS